MSAGAPPGSREVYVASCRFTGSGGEYFRIWIVNLLLSLVSLGLYSAWAKVRKAQYFRANTELAGHVFGYHGNPKAILRGRILALVLFSLYSWGFAFSRASGLVTMAVLTVVGPWLFMRGQQFALANTSFLGLRFGFRAEPLVAYRRLMPLLALWWMPQLLVWMGVETGAFSALIIPATWPWMHHRLKAYQHGNATYGNLRCAFEPATWGFYGVYAKSSGLIFLASSLGGLVFAGLYRSGVNPVLAAKSFQWIFGAAIGLIFFLLVGPYYAARLQQLVWNRTQLGGFRFRMRLRASELYKLAFKNAALTLLSAGLYWPWAAVALARYKLSCLEVESDASYAEPITAISAPNVDATGDGALDAFDLDIGL